LIAISKPYLPKFIEEAIRDAFIGGMMSNEIRKRLLEDDNLTLQATFDKARSLEIAQKNAEMCSSAEVQAVVQTDVFFLAP